MILDLYSKRQKRLNGENNDIYIYKEFSEKFRIQIIYILKRIFGYINNEINHEEVYCILVEELREHIGKYYLSDKKYLSDEDSCMNSYEEELFDFLNNTKNHENLLDTIEFLFKCLTELTNNNLKEMNKAILELNQRFAEHNLGYEFINNQIFRKDNEYIHSETVKPVLKLLNNQNYQGAEDEFLQAHKFYKNQDYKNVIFHCRLTFESTMKVICNKYNFDTIFDDKKQIQKIDINKSVASTLIKALSYNTFIDSKFENKLQSCVANEYLHGHDKIKEVPKHIASYILNMTATTILFLIEAEKNLENNHK